MGRCLATDVNTPGRLERWVAQYGGRLVLILLVLSALIQIFRLWRAGAQ